MAGMADLKRYRAKRRFGVTSEPSGETPAAPSHEPIFVIQKHGARRMHYDLRLEIGGALKSWAVPEGPCLDPRVRRLAVMVEDHPIDYASFEGAIPAGEYGAGGVIVWDRGTYVTLAEDPQKALDSGELKFRLVGEKLRGGWTLVKLKDANNWLLIKERDDAVRPIGEYDVLADRPESVISGLTVEDIKKPKRQPKKKAKRIAAKSIRGARTAPLPEKISPQLASDADEPPEGPDWLHEIKFDGYRTLARIDRGEARLFTRNRHDWTHRYQALAAAFRKLDCKSALIDGEIAVQDPRGVTSIDLLEKALAEGRDRDLTFFAFDLVHLDGYDLSAATLVERKSALEGLLAPLIDPRSPIQVSSHMAGGGAEFFAQAHRMGLEGIVSKKKDAPYVQGRTKTWLKIKRGYVGDFVVIGYTATAPSRVAALILAEEGASGLEFVGRVGTGIADGLAKELFSTLSAHRTDKSVTPAPRIANAVFVEPTTKARIAYNSRAEGGAPRQPVLLSVSPWRPAAPALRPRLVTDRDLAAIRLTNPDRAMFGSKTTTKLDIAVYYARVGDWMLPELLRRPLSLIRCPSGEKEDCFYQRHAFHGLPAGVATVALKEEEGRADFIHVENAQGFLGLTQFGAVEFHVWGCRVDDPDHPDRFVVDLDPDPELPFSQLKAAAELLRGRLADLGLSAFVRTTGGKGLHLVMAVTGADWPLLKSFAEAFAVSAAADAPQFFTSTAVKERRKGKIYIDWLRNTRGASAIASYSLRANADFTVAAPIGWEELRSLDSPRAFDRARMLKRLARLAHDPWTGLEDSAAPISARARRDVGMKD